MFLKLLKKLVDEYKADQTYFGGDVEEDLINFIYSICDERKYNKEIHGPLALGYIRALYDLGVLVALPAPAEGEVEVDAALAQRLLDMVEEPADPTRVCTECHVEYEREEKACPCCGWVPDADPLN
jgi:hypothetical protein